VKTSINHCTTIKNYKKFKEFHIVKSLTICYAEGQRVPPGKENLEEKDYG
jgi:hypothetical protein